MFLSSEYWLLFRQFLFLDIYLQYNFLGFLMVSRETKLNGSYRQENNCQYYFNTISACFLSSEDNIWCSPDQMTKFYLCSVAYYSIFLTSFLSSAESVILLYPVCLPSPARVKAVYYAFHKLSIYHGFTSHNEIWLGNSS